MNASMLTIPGNDPAFLIQAAMERIRQLEAEVRRLQKQSIPVENAIRIFQGNRLIKVAIEELLFIRAESNYSRVFLKNGEQYYTSRTLKSWVDEIKDASFIRCHRSFLVNKKEIVEIDRRMHEIIMKGGDRIPTSRRFQKLSVKAVFHKENAGVKTCTAKPDCTVRKLRLKSVRLG
jgi:two-component system LytT family response regulator